MERPQDYDNVRAIVKDYIVRATETAVRSKSKEAAVPKWVGRQYVEALSYGDALLTEEEIRIARNRGIQNASQDN